MFYCYFFLINTRVFPGQIDERNAGMFRSVDHGDNFFTKFEVTQAIFTIVIVGRCIKHQWFMSSNINGYLYLE